MSLKSSYVLLLLLAAPAWPAEKYVESDSPVFLEATPDRALVYFVGSHSQRGTVKVYLDKTPIGFLPRKSYTAVRVEPGYRLVWGPGNSEWFEFKRGRTYLLLYFKTSQGVAFKKWSGWFMDNPDLIRPLVLQRKLAHVETPEAGLEPLRAKLENKYKKALKKAGSKGEVVLPKRFSPVVYVAESKTRLNPFKTYPQRHSMLTIAELGIEYKYKKKEVVIPVTEIRRVSFAGFAASGSAQPWIFVSYGPAEAPNTAFFHGNTYNAIFTSIMSAMEMAKRADVQKGPEASAATGLTPEPSKPEGTISATVTEEAPFKWDDGFSSPGTSLSIDVVQTISPPPNGKIEISITSTGFVEAASTLALWQYVGAEYIKFEPTISAEGVVQIIPDTDSTYLGGYIRGQAFDIALVDEATDRRAHAKITPFPITAIGSGECRASAEVGTASGLVWVIRLSGFESGEDVTITFTSKAGVFKKETFTHNLVASETGEIAFPILYGTGSKSNAQVTAEGSHGCKLSLDFAIGKSAQKAK